MDDETGSVVQEPGSVVLAADIPPQLRPRGSSATITLVLTEDLSPNMVFRPSVSVDESTSKSSSSNTLQVQIENYRTFL